MFKIVSIFASVSLASGCNPDRTYTVDLSQLRDFKWDGRIQVHTTYHPAFLLGGEDEAERVTLRGRDDRIVELKLSPPNRRPHVALYGDPGQYAAEEVVVRRSASWRLPTKTKLRVKYEAEPGSTSQPASGTRQAIEEP